MSEKQDPMSAEYLQSILTRLRKRLTYAKDEMDITSHAIKCIESDLEKILQEDKEANEEANA